MIEATGNLWTYPADALVITTNGFVKKNGEAVMGRGCAKEAAQRFPWLPEELGRRITIYGNIPFGFFYEERALLTMPVKHNWWEAADIELIKKSTGYINLMADLYEFKYIVMPQPGCGNGQLDWNEVKPILNEILDDRFVAITWE